MTRQRMISIALPAITLTLVVAIAFAFADEKATSSPQSKFGDDDQKDAPKVPPVDVAKLAAQVAELQKQVADLQTRVREPQTPRVVAAGTATFQLGEVQDNATNVRVKLDADVAAKIGDDYIVLLTSRFPTSSYPFYVSYWKRAKDGFDITLVDVTLGPNSNVSYIFKINRSFPVDWIVVKK